MKKIRFKRYYKYIVIIIIGAWFVLKQLGLFTIPFGRLFFILLGIGIVLYGISKLLQTTEKTDTPDDSEWNRYNPTMVPPPPPPMNTTFTEAELQREGREQQEYSANVDTTYTNPSHINPTQSYTSQANESNTSQATNESHTSNASNASNASNQSSQNIKGFYGNDFDQYYSTQNSTQNNQHHSNSEPTQYDFDYFANKYKDKIKTGNGKFWGSCNSSEYNNEINNSVFIGDMSYGKEPWELKNMELHAFIGDITIDLTTAHIPQHETTIHVSTFIGDLKVFMPNDVTTGVSVTMNIFIGDMKVMKEKKSVMLGSSTVTSPNYAESERKINIIVNSFIGDIKVKKVG